MSQDTVVDVYCEICEERIATARIGDMTYPMTAEMFLSPDSHHGFPAPFEPGTDWEHMRCPHCRFRPFLCDDRINAGDRFVYTRKGAAEKPKDDQQETMYGILAQVATEGESSGGAIATCEICGKQFPKGQIGLHRNNHRRAEAKARKEKGHKP